MTTQEIQEWVNNLFANIEPEQTGIVTDCIITAINGYSDLAKGVVYDQMESRGITISTSVAKCKAHPA
jgi:hypothetical protein